MTTMSESRRHFVPGMGVEWLLPLYDPFTRLLGFDGARRDLLLQANLRPGDRVLDIGCGTGSLAVLVKQRFPDVEVIGLDPDGKALARATRKAQRAGADVRFDRGFADALEYPDASFDRVLSSFMFHHLERAAKDATLHEIRRVLKPGGRLLLLDFDGPQSELRPLRNGLHSHRRLRDNAEDTMLKLMVNAGLTDARSTGRREMWGGLLRIAFYQAGRSRP
jgi:ubiquinone/menaquinone biosynthesis C-methylase UbiE